MSVLTTYSSGTLSACFITVTHLTHLKTFDLKSLCVWLFCFVLFLYRMMYFIFFSSGLISHFYLGLIAVIQLLVIFLFNA